MDGDWEEIGRLVPGALKDQLAHDPVKTFAFDNSQELLWHGNDRGRVSSYYNQTILDQKNPTPPYTAFKGGEGPVKQLLFHERGVISLGPTWVHMALRTGPALWHITNDDMKNLQCMSYTSKGSSEILVAGLQDQMFIISVDKKMVTKQIHTKDHYTIMKRDRYICAATNKGSINLLDPITFNIVRVWNAHSYRVNDMDADGFLVTCGSSIRPQQSEMPDRLVNVFDLKNMVPLAPVPFPAGAAFVRLHPRMSTTAIVVSLYGQIHTVDLMNVNSSNVKQANVVNSWLTSIEIAPSGQAMGFGDNEGCVHVWGSASRAPRYAEVSNAVEFADPVEDSPVVDWKVETPLNTIGMPYYHDYLLSNWASHTIHEVGAPPPPVDQGFLGPLTVTPGFAVYGINARLTKRNQVENTRTPKHTSIVSKSSQFLSEMTNENTLGNETLRPNTAAGISNPSHFLEDPYRNVEIRYSKYGIADFNFGHFNKTAYSGLEPHISNSYANALLQLLTYTPLIRNLALLHTATICLNESCLLCELGFLCDNLEKAQGTVCHATNLLRALSHRPSAVHQGLVEDESPGSPLTNMLQGLNRFLLSDFEHNWTSVDPHSSKYHQAMQIRATDSMRCNTCRSGSTRYEHSYSTDLVYPPSPPPKMGARNARQAKPSFSQILKNSIEREETKGGWCNTCHRHNQPIAHKKSIQHIPAILMINAAIKSQEAKACWATPGWLPEEIGIIINQSGQFFCFEGADLKHHLQRQAHSISVYSLVGVAIEINNKALHEKPHLVSVINVAHSRPISPGESQWHLFNDFLVCPMKAEEALTFNMSWKLPSVVTYQRKMDNNTIDDSWKHHLNISLLFRDFIPPQPEHRTYTLLTEHETPVRGTVVALDAEFVSLRQHEISVDASGNQETIRPSIDALGRVSVLRGSGIDEGKAFIDDYIHIKEPIQDYKTRFSGIHAEDLDPTTSQHSLIPLKIAYKKLWVLLNLGCKFIGHNLAKDFRVCNIFVPDSQIIDTSKIFYLPRRKGTLGLSFLAWIVLKKDIQSGDHDSIEDALTALQLWKKHLEWADAGIFQTMLMDIYKEGHKVQFKAPSANRDIGLVAGGAIERTNTPPIGDIGSPSRGGASASGPTTPVRRPTGLSGTGASSAFSPGWTPGRGGLLSSGGVGGSPLRRPPGSGDTE